MRTKAAVAISGDLLVDGMADGKSQAEQAKWVSTFLKDFPTQIFVCSGNHDLVNALETPPQWLLDCRRSGVVVDEGRATHDGAIIACCPQDATVFSPKETWVNGADILLHHEPPYGYSVAQVGEGESQGSLDLADFIERPSAGPALVLSGHVEGASSQWSKVGRTVCLNIASHSHGGKIPPHAWIDWQARKAEIHTGARKITVEFQRKV